MTQTTNGLPAQMHSQTSIDAAESMTDGAKVQNTRLLQLLFNQGSVGATTAELTALYRKFYGACIVQGTVAARMSEMDGETVRAGIIRPTNTGRNAEVHYHVNAKELSGRFTVGELMDIMLEYLGHTHSSKAIEAANNAALEVCHIITGCIDNYDPQTNLDKSARYIKLPNIEYHRLKSLLSRVEVSQC